MAESRILNAPAMYWRVAGCGVRGRGARPRIEAHLHVVQFTGLSPGPTSCGRFCGPARWGPRRGAGRPHPAGAGVGPEGVIRPFALQETSVTAKVPNQRAGLHPMVTVSRMAVGGKPRRP